MDNLEEQFKELKPLHQKQIELVKYIDEFCAKEGIEYCLAYGSALGAKRHGGPIPWDDDIDIYMTINDYIKFKESFEARGDKEHFYLQEITVSGVITSVSKLRCNGTAFIEESFQNKDMHQGIYIDIFLLRNCPPTHFKRQKAVFANSYIILKNLSNIKYKKRKLVRPLLWFMRLFPKGFGLKRASAIKEKYNNCDSDTIADYELYNGKVKYFIPKNVIFPIKRIEFSGYNFCVPNDLDRYLEICYGDWKQIPEIDKIAWSQHAAVWSIDEDFRKFCPNIKNFADEKI